MLDDCEKKEIISQKHRGGIPKKGTADTIEAQAIAGHIGYNKTRQSVSEAFYWDNMCADIKHYVNSCDHCQRSKNLKMQKTNEVLHPIHVENKVRRSLFSI